MTAATVPSELPTTGPPDNKKSTNGARPAGLRVELTPLARLCGPERPDWDALFGAQRGVANPFCAPEWVETWYEFFTAPDDRFRVHGA